MSINRRFSIKKSNIAQAVAAMFTAFMLMLVSALPASAAPGNVPSFTDGIINVYKHENPGGTLTPGTGNEASAGGAAINGVPFTLYKVNGVDPTTSTGWNAISAVTSDTAIVPPALNNAATPTQVAIGGSNYTLTNAGTITTSGAGLASFTGLSQGLYVVVEGDRATNANPLITAKAAPFFVALPIVNNDAWTKTVNVHPKNVVAVAPTKTVAPDYLNDGAAASDGTLTWNVTQALPTFDTASRPTAVKLRDDLTNAGSTASTLASLVVKVGNITLAAPGDYTQTLSGGIMTIDLTAQGLTKVVSGATLTATYTTQGKIGPNNNSVTTYINNTTVGTATANVPLGRLTVTKKDSSNAQALDGAQFKLCEVASNGTNSGADCTPIASGTTGNNNGTLVFSNLKIANYVLVETAAPAGYAFPANPVTPVSVTAATADVAQTINNTKNSLPKLPLTGAQSKVIMTIIGAGLLAIAIGSMVYVRSRRNSGEI